MLDTIRTIKYGIIIAACMMLGILSSCNQEPKYTDNAIQSELLVISQNKVYDSNTLVVYYCNHLRTNNYLAPYYSENGMLCRYIDGQIVEIEQEDENGGK